jgi:hypothetical protein
MDLVHNIITYSFKSTFYNIHNPCALLHWDNLCTDFCASPFHFVFFISRSGLKGWGWGDQRGQECHGLSHLKSMEARFP